METAAILFAIAAIGGAAMAAMRLQGRELPPLWLAALHGLVAASGLVTLIYTVKSTPVPKFAWVALAGFVLAALGGLTLLLLFHLKKRPLPIPFILGHASVAVLSLILLLMGVFGL